MHPALLEHLRCPETGQRLELENAEYARGEISSAELVREDRQRSYPVREFIPRFVADAGHAHSFGAQWRRYRRTQLDSHSGQPISARRFWTATGWRAEQLAGQWVLDAGCGAGRFAEVALGAGATVVALDRSAAVDSCLANLGPHPRLHVVQGDLRALPLAGEQFARAYCLGVLHASPEPRRVLVELGRALAPGGRLCVDLYELSWRSLLQPKYLLRPLTRRLAEPRLHALVATWVPRLLPLRRRLRRVPALGRILERLVPVADPAADLPLADPLQLEWALLDTLDWYAPRFDRPQRARTLHRWLRGAGLVEVEVERRGPLVGKGLRMQAQQAEQGC